MSMKINPLMSSNQTDSVTKKDLPQETDFKFTLMSKIDSSDLKEKLQQMISEINTQGDKISKHMDIKDMKKYRELVKDFVNEVVSHSHKFSRENFLDKKGRHRVYGIVKLIDKNVDELAQELIQEEKNHIKILGKIDEIRGLILDLIA